MYSNMFKKLFSDTVIYTLPTIANRLIGIVFFIFLARYLGPSDFASIELLSLALIFINRIISLEINRGFGREVAGKTHLEISKLISTTYTFLLLGYLSLLFLALLMPSSYRTVYKNKCRIIFNSVNTRVHIQQFFFFDDFRDF